MSLDDLIRDLLAWSKDDIVPTDLQATCAASAEALTRLRDASRSLVNSLPDVMVDAIRAEWGNTNVAVIKHWREQVREALAGATED